MTLTGAYETLASYAPRLKGWQPGPEGLAIIIRFLIPHKDVQQLERTHLGLCISN